MTGRLRCWDQTLLPGALLLLAFGLGLYRLGYQAALGDDAFTLLIAGRDLGDLVRLSASEPHPPVFYLLMWAWVKVAGDGEFAGRFVAVWWAVLAIALIWRLGRSVGGRGGGSWAAFFLAASPFFVAYSQQARMYTMVIALGLASTYFAWRLVRGEMKGGRGASAGYVASTLLAVTTHFFALFLVAAQSVAVVVLSVARRDPRGLARWVGLQAFWLAAYLPWIVVAYPTLSTYRNELVGQPAVLDAYMRTLRAYVLGDTRSFDGDAALLAVFAWLALWGLWACLRRGRWLVLAYSALPPAIVWAVSLLRPMYFERYMLVFLPGFALLLAAALDHLRGYRRWRALLGVAAPLAAMVMVLPGYYAQTRYATADDMRGMVGYLAAMASPDAAVVTNLPASDPTLGYYYREGWPLAYLPESGDAMAIQRELDGLAARHGEIWYLPYGAERAVVEPWLDSHGVKVTDQWHSDARLVRYVFPGQAPADPLLTIDACFSNGMTLAGASVPAAVEPGRPLVLRIVWQASLPPASAPKAFVHLIDDRDRIWGQWDGQPGGAAEPTAWPAGATVTHTVGLVVLPGTPPGLYWLVAGLYDAASGKRFLLSTGADRAGLGAITVTPTSVPLAAAAYQIGERLDLSPAPGLVLAGVSLERLGGGSASELRAGQVLHVTTFWQAEAGAGSVPALALTLAGPDGKVVATASPGPLDGLGDPPGWRPGEIMRGQSYLFLPGDAPAGSYRIRLGDRVVGEARVVAP